MKNTVNFLSLVFIMAFVSCSNEPILDVSEESKTIDQSVTRKAATKKSTVPIKDYMFDMDLMNYIDGASSTIHRNEDGITVNFNTNGLIPGNAYTLWFVIFGNAPGPPTSTYAAGHIVGGSGKGNFSGHKSVGEIFNNPLTAEVHLALRTHGPAQPGMIPTQIHTMNGGCESGFPSGPSLHADSDESGYCANVQVAIHKIE